MEQYFDIRLTDDQLRAISSVGLAHMGDAVFEILVRGWLCAHGKATGKGLHQATIQLVRAEHQAACAEKILPMLTEEELAVFRRGRNAQVHSIPSHASRAQYSTATTARDRVRRKLALQEKDYAATQERDALRLSGDLITANLYRMERGESKLVCQNYYDEDLAEVTIPLDPLLTPQQNAAKYYKRYTKAKTAEKYLREQMSLARRDLAYLESILQEIQQAETEQDFLDIRGEMSDAGYIRKQGKKVLQRPSKPREFKTSGGFRVLVGRNNRQNDKLTLKDADYRDLWFHVQKLHGSHVILCTNGGEPGDQDITEAAGLAAYYSQAKDSANVPVDCTQVKYVKKPVGARPGMVIYTTYRTVNVTPAEDLVRRLQNGK